MPIQPKLFGYPLPLPRRLPPRRILVTGLLGSLTLILFLASSFSFSTAAPARQLSEHIPPGARLPKLSIPAFHNPFRTVPVHKPPVQANSTSGEAKWYSDWKWLNPFSSTITLDEDRSVLPPLRRRPAVYTFYDAMAAEDDATRAAENELLLIWRRAWWAQGFRPIVLGRPEALNNPLHEALHVQQLDAALEADVFRWLAWQQMDAGVLVHYRALPMASYHHPLLAYLRRGHYPVLTRYDGLGTGVFAGNGAVVTAALQQVLNSGALNQTTSFLDAFATDAFHVDGGHDGIAFYSAETVASKYHLFSDEMTHSTATGLRSLGRLINAHLHTTFQNALTAGIAVLHPHPQHTTALVQPAMRIATYLTECSESPLPSSCPPNQASCKPCVAAHPLRIVTPAVFQNASDLYTIGTVPHPYTFAALTSERDMLDVAYIRRQTARDSWLVAATKELMGTGVGTAPRLVRFKEAVAGEWGQAHSLWLVPEQAMADELDWHFGFAIPKNVTDKGTSTSPVPGSKASTTTLPFFQPERVVPSPAEMQRQERIIERAAAVVTSSVRHSRAIRDTVEAWNLADTEAWRFARAYAARARVERRRWEEDETKFGGIAGLAAASSSARSLSWSRWVDAFQS
ncbi:MAG: hypothetical protein M1826_007478 [Phylliscum demangeonii]|nr:MAG: hypothetical protein M1826_007478 [Phylliscum demangeonii]